jgi:hypothetical protein
LLSRKFSLGITLLLPLPQSAAIRPSIWAWRRSTLVLPLGFLKLNPVIVSPLLLVPRVPIKECDDPLFGRGKLAGVFVDINPRPTAVVVSDELFTFFRRSKYLHFGFAAIIVRDPC